MSPAERDAHTTHVPITAANNEAIDLWHGQQYSGVHLIWAYIGRQHECTSGVQPLGENGDVEHATAHG